VRTYLGHGDTLVFVAVVDQQDALVFPVAFFFYAAFFGDDTVVVRLDVVQAAVLLERSLLVS